VPDDLDLIPRSVRDKLDRIGIKLHLRDWQAFTRMERQRLCDLPCSSEAEMRDYGVELAQLVRRVTGAAPEALPPKIPR